MRCIYTLRSDQIPCEDGQTLTVYGVNVWTADHLIMSVPDVFCDKRKTLDLIYRCNKFKLEPLHLMDVIYDELNSSVF